MLYKEDMELSKDASEALALPGMTRNFGNPNETLVPIVTLSKLPRLDERKVVLLAPATIT